MKCLSTDTITGLPCNRTVGRDGCPNHGNYHIQERLRQANRPVQPKPEQQQMLLASPMDLIRQGYEMERQLRTNSDHICGCQG